jgi:hypothetical protein
MTTKAYPIESWVDPRIAIHTSRLGGKGLFASEQIKTCEVVVVWGGKIFTREQITKGEAKKGSTWLGIPPFHLILRI